ncbi:MAG: M28 family metallopeptidase [Pyrinomonadaceae bacterium]
MRKLSSSFCLTLLLCLSAQAQTSGAAGAAAAVGGRFKAQVAAISAGTNGEARRAAVTKRLDELGVKYRLEEFAAAGDQRRGVNVFAELPVAAGGAAKRRLMLGAHYDRVAEGQGALDNASGSAVVLELLAALKAKPLSHTSVTVAFFDLEERGLLGSRAYVAAAQEKKALPDLFLNFDVFGYGDTLWVMSPTNDTPAAQALAQAAEANKFPLRVGTEYPPSDHLSFLPAKVETLSFSLIGGEEIPHILKIFKREQPAQVPRALTIIHTPNDTPDKLDPAAVARALPVIEGAIRLMDVK